MSKQRCMAEVRRNGVRGQCHNSERDGGYCGIHQGRGVTYPNLLEINRELLAALEGLVDAYFSSCDPIVQIDAARAAIAKAKVER